MEVPAQIDTEDVLFGYRLSGAVVIKKIVVGGLGVV